jgi:hypothetical protein
VLKWSSSIRECALSSPTTFAAVETGTRVSIPFGEAGSIGRDSAITCLSAPAPPTMAHRSAHTAVASDRNAAERALCSSVDPAQPAISSSTLTSNGTPVPAFDRPFATRDCGVPFGVRTPQHRGAQPFGQHDRPRSTFPALRCGSSVLHERSSMVASRGRRSMCYRLCDLAGCRERDDDRRNPRTTQPNPRPSRREKGAPHYRRPRRRTSFVGAGSRLFPSPCEWPLDKARS